MKNSHVVGEKLLVTHCDFIGILKERNVDVEKRFGLLSKEKHSCCKKRSTNCRLVFRASIPSSCGSAEILQVASNPILCTQPSGVPEILKTSVSECFVEGNVELFIIGKNFLKDAHLIFCEKNEDDETSLVTWEKKILPEQDYLHHTHLVCTVPPYRLRSIEEPVTVQVFVKSGGKTSDPHFFTYLPDSKELECSYETEENEHIQGEFTSVTPLANELYWSNGSNPALVELPVMLQTTPHQPVSFRPTLILPSSGYQVVSSNINTKLSGGCYVTLPERTNTSSIELILHQKHAQGLVGYSDSLKLNEKEDKNESNFLKKAKKSMRSLKIADNDLKAKRIKTAHNRVAGGNQYLGKLSRTHSDSCIESGSDSSGQSECPFKQDLPRHLYQVSDSQSQLTKEKSIEDKAYNLLTHLEFTDVSQKDVTTDSCSDHSKDPLQQPQAFLNHLIQESDSLNHWSGVGSVKNRGDTPLHSMVRETSQLDNHGDNLTHKFSVGTTEVELYEPSYSMVCDEQFDYSNNHCSSAENTICKTGNVVGENKMIELNGHDVSEYFAEQNVSFTNPEVNLDTVLIQHDNSIGKSNLESDLINKYDSCFTERRETEQQVGESHILKSSQQTENSFSEAFLQNMEICYDTYPQSCQEANTVGSEEKQCFPSLGDGNEHNMSSTSFNTISSAAMTDNYLKWDSQEQKTSSMLPASDKQLKSVLQVEHQTLGLDILTNIPFDSYEESQKLQNFESCNSRPSSVASSDTDPNYSAATSESHVTSCFENKPLVSQSNKPMFLKYTIAPSTKLTTAPVIFIHPKNLADTQCESTLFDASTSFKSLPFLQIGTCKPEIFTSLALDVSNMQSALKSNGNVPPTSNEGSAAQYTTSIDNTPTGQLSTPFDTRSVKERLNPKSIAPVIVNTTITYTAAVSDISINNDMSRVRVELPTPMKVNHADPSCEMPPVISDSINLKTKVHQTTNQLVDLSGKDEPVKQTSNQAQVNMQSNKCHLWQNCTSNLLESIKKALKPFDPKVLNAAAELMKLLSSSVHRQDNSVSLLKIHNQNNTTEVDVTLTQNDNNQNDSPEVDITETQNNFLEVDGTVTQNIHNQSNYTEVDLTLEQNTYYQNNSKAVNIVVANEELLIDSSLSGQTRDRNLNFSNYFQEAVGQFQLNTTSHNNSCSTEQMELGTCSYVCNTQEEQSSVISEPVELKSISKPSLHSDHTEKT
ncbi:uncharacterized protein LOC143250802 isoform X2 [Tachypleus tridentatus]|uniref:uncharacterized protein LOC143250802 isoform X2 n=1 Tax=Tachypleus tridentatus TaxID=6853 RepID=UPI003FCFBA55